MEVFSISKWSSGAKRNYCHGKEVAGLPNEYFNATKYILYLKIYDSRTLYSSQFE
jgi:hypothetical protein